MKNVGETLQKILKQKDLTQVQAAQIVGLTRVWFNKIIHKEDCSCATLEQICYGLHISPAVFFDAYWTSDAGDFATATMDSGIDTSMLCRENELLRNLLAEKERTISILLGEYSGQKKDSEI